MVFWWVNVRIDFWNIFSKIGVCRIFCWLKMYGNSFFFCLIRRKWIRCCEIVWLFLNLENLFLELWGVFCVIWMNIVCWWEFLNCGRNWLLFLDLSKCVLIWIMKCLIIVFRKVISNGMGVICGICGKNLMKNWVVNLFGCVCSIFWIFIVLFWIVGEWLLLLLLCCCFFFV